jgi:hypothetical protein
MSTLSPTDYPRTFNVAFRADDGSIVVLSSFAVKLETELNEANRKLSEIEALLNRTDHYATLRNIVRDILKS